MKVKPIFNSVDDVNREEYFNYFGIENVRDFINGKQESGLQYDCIRRMRQSMFNYVTVFINKYLDRKAYVLVDPDLDGYSASAIVIRDGFGFEEVTPVFHSKKQHGIDDEIIDLIPEGCILIVPDASVDNVMIPKLDEKDVVTVAIDHHPTIEGENDLNNDKHCYICNQWLNVFGDRHQSGSMFTFQYVFYGRKNYDRINAELGVLGNFGDVQEVNLQETRYINAKVENVEHEFLKAMFLQFSDEKYYLYPDAVGWGIGPKFNAVIRSNNAELKRQLFDSLCNETYNVDSGIAEACDAQHMYQKDHVKSIVDGLEFDESHKVIIVKTQHDDEINGINGLIANRIQSQKNKPVFAVSLNEETGMYRGSLRSPVDIKTILNNTGLVTAHGHERAAGILKLDPNDEEQLLKMLDEMDLGGDETEVMLSCKPKELTRDIFDWFSCNKTSCVPYWGQGIPVPTVHMKYKTRFEDINFVGKYKSDVWFNIDGECRYSIHRDFIGRANKITWGIMIDTGVVNKYGRSKLVQNSGPVEIEIIGTLKKVKGQNILEVRDWEFHPIAEEDEFDVF